MAQVITFNKMLAKGVIRDVARVLDMPYKEADDFAKLIPNRLGITLKGYEKNGEFIEGAWELEPKNPLCPLLAPPMLEALGALLEKEF